MSTNLLRRLERLLEEERTEVRQDLSSLSDEELVERLSARIHAHLPTAPAVSPDSLLPDVSDEELLIRIDRGRDRVAPMKSWCWGCGEVTPYTRYPSPSCTRCHGIPEIEARVEALSRSLREHAAGAFEWYPVCVESTERELQEARTALARARQRVERARKPSPSLPTGRDGTKEDTGQDGEEIGL